MGHCASLNFSLPLKEVDIVKPYREYVGDESRVSKANDYNSETM